VYQGAQAERAAGNFFRKGNLIALRELALRRTADRIEGDVRAYRVEQSIDAIWKTGAVLLACVGPAGGEQVVRACARLANQLGARWHAVYVETPALQQPAGAQHENVLDQLRLADKLGAVTAVLPGSDVAPILAEYAEQHNLSKLVLGRPARRRRCPGTRRWRAAWRGWRRRST
jgi:two-component system sensor histidine kinase KdpD